MILNIAGVEDKHSVQRHNKTARRHQAQRPHVPTGDYQINISSIYIIDDIDHIDHNVIYIDVLAGSHSSHNLRVASKLSVEGWSLPYQKN